MLMQFSDSLVLGVNQDLANTREPERECERECEREAETSSRERDAASPSASVSAVCYVVFV